MRIINFGLILILSFGLLSGCNGALGNINAGTDIERGLSYIAAAIVTHGILQALFNK